MGRRLETGFALLAAGIVVLTLVAVAGTAGPGKKDPEADSVAFDPAVPGEYEFSSPNRSGKATVDGEQFDSVRAALRAADPGDTVRLRGRFDERVVVNTDNVTLTGPPDGFARIDGSGQGNVLVLNGDNVTIRRVWVSDSGRDASENDAGIWVNGTAARILDSRLTDITFGIWVDGVDDVLIRNNTIVGRESVRPLSYRGNGIQLWETTDSRVADNRITDVRDGIYYSWASDVTARNNTMWDLRYGVHYMYSDDCRLVDNLAFDNDVGYALMVSERLDLENNTAINNTGESGHGILLKSIDETTIRNNTLVGNGDGIYVYNSLDNVIAGNLVLANDVGVHLAAGSVRETVYGNSFIHNDQPVRAVTSQQVAWNTTDRGNYWADARTVDRDDDGVSEVRYRPAGLVEHLVRRHPRAAVFANSPAFDAIRLAESSLPVVAAPGVVDHHPLVAPPHDNWRRYYARDQRN